MERKLARIFGMMGENSAKQIILEYFMKKDRIK